MYHKVIYIKYMELQKPGPFLTSWFQWWLLTNSFSIPTVVPSDDWKKPLKIFINQATQYTCELDFYHSLADGKTKTQKGSMPYQRAQRGLVAELQAKQLEPRYTNIWCCTLLLSYITSQVFLPSLRPQSLSNSELFYHYSSSSKPFHCLLSLDNTLSVTQPCVTLLAALDSHVCWRLQNQLSYLAFTDSSCLKFHHISLTAILCL